MKATDTLELGLLVSQKKKKETYNLVSCWVVFEAGWKNPPPKGTSQDSSTCMYWHAATASSTDIWRH